MSTSQEIWLKEVAELVRDSEIAENSATIEDQVHWPLKDWRPFLHLACEPEMPMKYPVRVGLAQDVTCDKCLRKIAVYDFLPGTGPGPEWLSALRARFEGTIG